MIPNLKRCNHNMGHKNIIYYLIKDVGYQEWGERFVFLYRKPGGAVELLEYRQIKSLSRLFFSLFKSETYIFGFNIFKFWSS